MNSTHDSKFSAKAIDLTFQKTSKVSHSTSTPSLSIELKHSIQVDDKDTTIHIDTNQSKHHRHLLKNLVDELEEEDLLDLSKFCKEQKKTKMKKMQEEIINALRFQKKELDESILLLKKRVKMQIKFKWARIYPSMAMMIVTGIGMAHLYYLLKNNHEEEHHLLDSEQTYRDLTRSILHNFYDYHLSDLSSRNNIYCSKSYGYHASIAYCIPRTFFNIKCSSPYMPLDVNEDYDRYRHGALDNWCIQIDRARSIKRFLLSHDFFDSITSFQKITFLAFFLFGEFAPLILILIVLLSSTYDHNESITKRYAQGFDLDTAEYKQILNTANKHTIYWGKHSYRMLQSDLENESKKITVHLDRFDKAENMRRAFLNGGSKRNAKTLPIGKLFYNEAKDCYECEPKIIAKIFAFAGISIDQLNKSAKKAARTTFESGAHSKHNVILIYANNARISHPLFNFFNRLNTEQAEPPVIPRNPNERLLFQKLTNLKKFTEQGGKAYDKPKILRNIYEFAGLIPKRKYKG